MKCVESVLFYFLHLLSAEQECLPTAYATVIVLSNMSERRVLLILLPLPAAVRITSLYLDSLARVGGRVPSSKRFIEVPCCRSSSMASLKSICAATRLALSKSVKLTAEKIGVNTSSRVACVVPGLESGNWKIRIVTQCSKTTPRKESQSCTYSTVFALE